MDESRVSVGRTFVCFRASISRTGEAHERMIAWSVVAGVLGALGTWAWVSWLARRQSPRGPVFYWVLGLAALLPAWLIGFVGLFGASTARRPEVSLSFPFILSSSVALFGVILTDAAVKRLGESGRAHRPVKYWLLGVAALFPAWCIALLGLTWTRP